MKQSNYHLDRARSSLERARHLLAEAGDWLIAYGESLPTDGSARNAIIHGQDIYNVIFSAVTRVENALKRIEEHHETDSD